MPDTDGSADQDREKRGVRQVHRRSVGKPRGPGEKEKERQAGWDSSVHMARAVPGPTGRTAPVSTQLLEQSHAMTYAYHMLCVCVCVCV